MYMYHPADIDECLSSVCSVNAICENTIGNYTCNCNPGYSGDGVECNGNP